KASATGAVSGYQIKYRPSSGKWKTVKVSGKKLNKTIKNLKKDKTYQVKIRSYYTYRGKKLYSSWGKTKKVKLK
ncbi:MAG: fibronectin type III domain-containing protein, partial [Lachnospiraceae bacterium]|nr:fibronectin type III domain-containing protein [Lachnospiraceae bacterium]